MSFASSQHLKDCLAVGVLKQKQAEAQKQAEHLKAQIFLQELSIKKIQKQYK